jgi:hypothetical protein
MGLKLTNNATSVLAANINAATTSFAIQSGDEGTFPTLGVGDWHPITVVDASGNREVMRCTARSGVTLTVVRAQEGTTALSFSAGDRVDVRLTAGAFLEAVSDATRLSTGTVDRALLGDGLQAIATEIADLDAVDATGFYRNASDATGSPTAHAGFFSHIESDDGSAYQIWRRADSADTRERVRALDIWGSWTQLRTSASAQDALFYSKAGGALSGKLTTVASTTDNGAALNIAAGDVPATPADGDIWSTAAAIFARLAGVTRQFAFVDAVLALAGGTLTGLLSTKASATDSAGLRIPHGVAPTSPVNGDLWSTTAALLARIGGATKTVQFVEDLPESVDLQTFTASGTWNKPTNAKFVFVQVWGGGGGGGGGIFGSGGGYAEHWFLASQLPAAVTVTVGAASGLDAPGNQSSFSLVVATGGLHRGGPPGGYNTLVGENGGVGSSSGGGNTAMAGAGGPSGTSRFGGGNGGEPGVAPGGGGNPGARGQVRVTTFR